MIEIVTLQAVSSDGSLQPVELRLREAKEVRIEVVLAGCNIGEYSGGHVSAALRKARRALEERGLILCCQGARPDVHSSGMLQQSSNGREAYVLSGDGDIANVEVVDVLAPADPSEVGTVDAQEANIFRFFGLERPTRNDR